MTNPDTKQRILDAAEALFADKGFAETSLRALTQAADVNLAAVHYHFGSKERLFVQVLGRIIAPVNAERLHLFDELEAKTSELQLEDVLRAFLQPAMALAACGDERATHLRQLMGRLQSQSSKMQEEFKEIFREVIMRFAALISRTVPGLEPATLVWRIHFLIGSMVFTFGDPQGIEQMSQGMCKVDGGSAHCEQMVTAFAGAFRAPAPDSQPSPTNSPRA